MLLGLSGCWLSATSNPVCLSSVLDVSLTGCLVALKSFCLGINLMTGCLVARLPDCLVAWLTGCLVARLPDCLVAWLSGCLVVGWPD
jgi:hypothetical protein